MPNLTLCPSIGHGTSDIWSGAEPSLVVYRYQCPVHAKLLIKRLIDVCHSRRAPINSSIPFGLVISRVMSIRSAINFWLAGKLASWRDFLSGVEPQIRNRLSNIRNETFCTLNAAAAFFDGDKAAPLGTLLPKFNIIISREI